MTHPSEPAREGVTYIHKVDSNKHRQEKGPPKAGQQRGTSLTKDLAQSPLRGAVSQVGGKERRRLQILPEKDPVPEKETVQTPWSSSVSRGEKVEDCLQRPA